MIEYITRVRGILGEASIGVSDYVIHQALEDNSTYVYRQMMVPQDTLRIEEPRTNARPSWYTYVNHKVWKALDINWLDDTSFIDFDGTAITLGADGSFDKYTGYLTLTTPEGKRDVRITGTTVKVYRASLYAILRLMSDKTGYYDYSYSGGSQSENQWFSNLIALRASLMEYTEI